MIKKMIQLFRVFFPSWKFFDVHFETPDLFVCISTDGATFGEWTPSLPKIQNRSWKKLWINTNENFLFAGHSLVEYLANDVRDGSDSTTSLALVKNLVCFQLVANKTNFIKFQFKLSLKPDSNEPLYQSPTFEANS
jgi:hypothetical protein